MASKMRAYNPSHPLFFRNFPRSVKRMFFYQLVLICLFIVLLLYYFGYFGNMNTSKTKINNDIIGFFPVNNDAARITWDHAVNSQSKLAKSLKSDVMMIEADIMQRFWGTSKREMTAIMAHPPDVESDLSFKQFIELTGSVPNKGIKLDFKVIEILEISLQHLDVVRNAGKLIGPVIINADIARGANLEPGVPARIDAVKFLQLTEQYTPWAALSVGWNTKSIGRSYNWQDMFTMHRYLITVLKSSNIPVLTFPVRAALCTKTALPKFKWLLDMWKQSSLTVWTAGSDTHSVKDLLRLRHKLNKEQLFLDLPHLTDKERSEFLAARDDPAARQRLLGAESARTVRPDEWDKVYNLRGKDSVLYAGTESLVIGGRCVGLVSKGEHLPRGGNTVYLSGKITFFTADDAPKQTNSKVGFITVVFRTRNTLGESMELSDGAHLTLRANGQLSITYKSTESQSGRAFHVETLFDSQPPDPRNICYNFTASDNGATLRFEASLLAGCDTATGADPPGPIVGRKSLELPVPAGVTLAPYRVNFLTWTRDDTMRYHLAAIDELGFDK